MKRPDLAALILAGFCAAAIATLAALGVNIPDVLAYLATGALSAGAGVAVQSAVASSSAPEPEPAKPVAPLVDQLAGAAHAP